jgi:hypothetical protein
MDTPTIIGSLGATLILIAFILNQLNKWKKTDLSYDLVNLLGSILLIVFSVMINAWPFIILNSVWAIVSLRDVIIDIKK